MSLKFPCGVALKNMVSSFFGDGRKKILTMRRKLPLTKSVEMRRQRFSLQLQILGLKNLTEDGDLLYSTSLLERSLTTILILTTHYNPF